ncbi:GUN4 domain-containing protein [Calothrix sp. FACHB-156]|nr:GUN4 domain-containing protein [Calothrix sp. FACHB-156]
MKKILILTANPRGTTQLRFDEEVREIRAGLKQAEHRNEFVLESRWAVRPRDIQRAMLEVNPQIVHFSGHGAGDEGLVFEDEVGQAKLVDGEALAGLFELFADQVECVVLNSCYSEMQTEAITQHINYVIGMRKAIGDKSAIEFAVGFYDALGAGRSVEFAYKFGCAAIGLSGTQEQLKPILKKKPNIYKKLIKTSLPEEELSVIYEDESEVHQMSYQQEYARLKSLLEDKKWKMADAETAEMMLKVSGRQKEGWLTVEDLNNYPCEDLRTLDKLWKKYSNGQFGFSVQRRIWEEVAGIPIKVENNEPLLNRFAERVGWRTVKVSNDKIEYEQILPDQIKYDINAPKGHLPTVYKIGVLWYGVGYGGAFGGSSLMQRLEHCKIS